MQVGGLPWSKTYIAFSGTLPNIVSLTTEVRGFAFLIEVLGGMARCLYRGNLRYRSAGGNIITQLVTDDRTGMPLFDGTLSMVGCPASVFITGRLTVTPEVRLRLI